MGVLATKIWLNELMFSVKEPALKRSYGLTKSSQNQSVVKISLRWGKDEITFKAIEKYHKKNIIEKLYRNTLNLKTAGKKLLTGEMET